MQITKGKRARAQRVVIYGPEGIGKSSLAAQFPNPLFIDTEGSTDNMDVTRADKPTSWTMLMNHIAFVKANPTICQTLVIDTIDWAEALALEYICAQHNKSGIEDFGWGAGYTYLIEEIGRLLDRLQELVELGINVVLTAHAQVKKFTKPDEMGGYDRYELKLSNKKTETNVSAKVKEWADMVLFLNYKTYIVTDDKTKKQKAQGGKKSMDRASGSGVFARDPDALIDLVELELNDDLIKMQSDKATCAIYQRALQDRALDYYQQYVSLDDLESRVQMRDHFEKAIKDVLIRKVYTDEISKVVHAVEISTAWRVEGTLREFAKFKSVNMWFSYPVHNIDDTGVLADIQLEDNKPLWQKAKESRKSKDQNLKERNEKLEVAYGALFDGSAPVTITEMREYLDLKSNKSVENYIKEHDGFDFKKGVIFKIDTTKEKEK